MEIGNTTPDEPGVNILGYITFRKLKHYVPVICFTDPITHDRYDLLRSSLEEVLEEYDELYDKVEAKADEYNILVAENTMLRSKTEQPEMTRQAAHKRLDRYLQLLEEKRELEDSLKALEQQNTDLIRQVEGSEAEEKILRDQNCCLKEIKEQLDDRGFNAENTGLGVQAKTDDPMISELEEDRQEEERLTDQKDEKDVLRSEMSHPTTTDKEEKLPEMSCLIEDKEKKKDEASKLPSTESEKLQAKKNTRRNQLRKKFRKNKQQREMKKTDDNLLLKPAVERKDQKDEKNVLSSEMSDPVADKKQLKSEISKLDEFNTQSSNIKSCKDSFSPGMNNPTADEAEMKHEVSKLPEMGDLIANKGEFRDAESKLSEVASEKLQSEKDTTRKLSGIKGGKKKWQKEMRKADAHALKDEASKLSETNTVSNNSKELAATTLKHSAITQMAQQMEEERMTEEDDEHCQVKDRNPMEELASPQDEQNQMKASEVGNLETKKKLADLRSKSEKLKADQSKLLNKKQENGLQLQGLTLQIADWHQEMGKNQSLQLLDREQSRNRAKVKAKMHLHLLRNRYDGVMKPVENLQNDATLMRNLNAELHELLETERTRLPHLVREEQKIADEYGARVAKGTNLKESMDHFLERGETVRKMDKVTKNELKEEPQNRKLYTKKLEKSQLKSQPWKARYGEKLDSLEKAVNNMGEMVEIVAMAIYKNCWSMDMQLSIYMEELKMMQ